MNANQINFPASNGRNMVIAKELEEISGILQNKSEDLKLQEIAVLRKRQDFEASQNDFLCILKCEAQHMCDAHISSIISYGEEIESRLNEVFNRIKQSCFKMTRQNDSKMSQFKQLQDQVKFLTDELDQAELRAKTAEDAAKAARKLICNLKEERDSLRKKLITSEAAADIMRSSQEFVGTLSKMDPSTLSFNEGFALPSNSLLRRGRLSQSRAELVPERPSSTRTKTHIPSSMLSSASTRKNSFSSAKHKPARPLRPASSSSNPCCKSVSSPCLTVIKPLHQLTCLQSASPPLQPSQTPNKTHENVNRHQPGANQFQLEDCRQHSSVVVIKNVHPLLNSNALTNNIANRPSFQSKHLALNVDVNLRRSPATRLCHSPPATAPSNPIKEENLTPLNSRMTHYTDHGKNIQHYDDIPSPFEAPSSSPETFDKYLAARRRVSPPPLSLSKEMRLASADGSPPALMTFTIASPRANPYPQQPSRQQSVRRDCDTRHSSAMTQHDQPVQHLELPGPIRHPLQLQQNRQEWTGHARDGVSSSKGASRVTLREASLADPLPRCSPSSMIQRCNDNDNRSQKEKINERNDDHKKEVSNRSKIENTNASTRIRENTKETSFFNLIALRRQETLNESKSGQVERIGMNAPSDDESLQSESVNKINSSAIQHSNSSSQHDSVIYAQIFSQRDQEPHLNHQKNTSSSSLTSISHHVSRLHSAHSASSLSAVPLAHSEAPPLRLSETVNESSISGKIVNSRAVYERLKLAAAALDSSSETSSTLSGEASPVSTALIKRTAKSSTESKLENRQDLHSNNNPLLKKSASLSKFLSRNNVHENSEDKIQSSFENRSPHRRSFLERASSANCQDGVRLHPTLLLSKIQGQNFELSGQFSQQAGDSLDLQKTTLNENFRPTSLSSPVPSAKGKGRFDKLKAMLERNRIDDSNST